MKIWPFDLGGGGERRPHLQCRQLKTALEPFEKIRERGRRRMEIMVEFHSLWNLLPAMKIAKALEPFETIWYEDPIRMDSLADLKRYAEASPAPIWPARRSRPLAFSRPAAETDAAGIVMLDLSWCGGLRKRARSPRWRTPGTCRSRRTTAPARSCSAPRPTFR